MCSHYRKCPSTGKFQHEDKASAKTHIKNLKRNGNSVSRLEIYRCRSCGKLHVGYHATSVADRQRELLRRYHKAKLRELARLNAGYGVLEKFGAYLGTCRSREITAV